MKRIILAKSIKITLAAVAVLLFLLMTACTNTEEDMKQITSFDTITISITGTMASTEEYELVRTADGVDFSYYSGGWNFNEDMDREECLINRVAGNEENYQQMLALLNECEVMEWNGFNESNPNVLDGESFSFSATVNDGTTISAGGSNAYPKNYATLLHAIEAIVLEKPMS